MGKASDSPALVPPAPDADEPCCASGQSLAPLGLEIHPFTLSFQSPGETGASVAKDVCVVLL